MGTRGRVRTYAVAAAVVTLISALSGCSGGGGGPDTDVRGTWTLVSAITPEGPLNLLGEGLVSLTFDPEGVGGRGPCNDYGSDYELDGRDLDLVGGISHTSAGCDGAAGELEAGYISALGRVETAQIRAGSLVLSGEEIELRFDPVPGWPRDEVVGHTWLLHSWTVTTGAASSRPQWKPGLRPFLRLDEGGRRGGALSASTGCRSMEGRWQDWHGSPTVTEARWRGHCREGLMDQEVAVGSALSEFRLELRRRAGRTELVLTQAHGSESGVRTVLVFRR